MDEPREEPMQNDVDDWTDAQAEEKISAVFGSKNKAPPRLNNAEISQAVEIPTVFSPTFYTSELYDHTPILAIGSLPQTPHGGISFSDLLGPYLSSSLKKMCPAKPVKPTAELNNSVSTPKDPIA